MQKGTRKQAQQPVQWCNSQLAAGTMPWVAVCKSSIPQSIPVDRRGSHAGLQEQCPHHGAATPLPSQSLHPPEHQQPSSWWGALHKGSRAAVLQLPLLQGEPRTALEEAPHPLLQPLSVIISSEVCVLLKPRSSPAQGSSCSRMGPLSSVIWVSLHFIPHAGALQCCSIAWCRRGSCSHARAGRH